MIGDSAVGKTSLMHRFVQNKFLAECTPTVNASFRSKDVIVSTPKGNQDILRLQLWDTAGQERYRSLARIYFQGADAAILTYDIGHR
jgi:small GTP-binding protein